MNNTTLIVILIVVFAGVGGFFLFSGGTTAPQESGETDTNEAARSYSAVPDFALLDYDGNTVTPNDFPGKALVINSWATWCPFCVDELPAFGALQEEFSDEIVVIAIDRAESRSRAKSYTDNLAVTGDMVFLLDPDDRFYQSIGGFSMPETLFVDTEGNIRVHKRGPMDLNEMRDKVERIL